MSWNSVRPCVSMSLNQEETCGARCSKDCETFSPAQKSFCAEWISRLLNIYFYIYLIFFNYFMLFLEYGSFPKISFTNIEKEQTWSDGYLSNQLLKIKLMQIYHRALVRRVQLRLKIQTLMGFGVGLFCYLRRSFSL